MMVSFIRRIFVLTALMVLTLSLPLGAVAQSGAPDGTIRVMIFNTHHGAGNDDCEDPDVPDGEIPEAECALDLERIADVIRAEHPDVVALQEIDRFWARSGSVDQSRELASMLEMEVWFGGNLDHDSDDHAGEPHQYGVAILSNDPITSCENTFLPTAEGEEQRGLLEARVDVEGAGEIAVLNTHLDHKEVVNRTAQAEAVAEYVEGISVPIVLMGDFNAEPGDGDLTTIESLLTDAWGVAGEEGEGLTYPAHPDEDPEKRIDMIFVSPDIAVTDLYVQESNEARMAADHLPVVADLTLANGATLVASPVASPVIN